MSEELIFMMGKFEARFPTDRLYSTNHMWLLPLAGSTPDNDAQGRGRYRVGFTAYSVRLLRDVYFLDWSFDAPADVRSGQEIGQVESSKAVSSLYPPGPGTITGFNAALLSDPTPINTDNYAAGWLYEFTSADAAGLFTPPQYIAHMESKWEQTQRLLKGQMNE